MGRQCPPLSPVSVLRASCPLPAKQILFLPRSGITSPRPFRGRQARPAPSPAGRGWGSARPPLPLPAGTAGGASVPLAVWGAGPAEGPEQGLGSPPGSSLGLWCSTRPRPGPLGARAAENHQHAAWPAPAHRVCGTPAPVGFLSPATLPGTHRSPIPGSGAPGLGSRACDESPGGNEGWSPGRSWERPWLVSPAPTPHHKWGEARTCHGTRRVGPLGPSQWLGNPRQQRVFKCGLWGF